MCGPRCRNLCPSHRLLVEATNAVRGVSLDQTDTLYFGRSNLHLKPQVQPFDPEDNVDHLLPQAFVLKLISNQDSFIQPWSQVGVAAEHPAVTLSLRCIAYAKSLALLWI
jgi:hypothetical protein